MLKKQENNNTPNPLYAYLPKDLARIVENYMVFNDMVCYVPRGLSAKMFIVSGMSMNVPNTSFPLRGPHHIKHPVNTTSLVKKKPTGTVHIDKMTHHKKNSPNILRRGNKLNKMFKMFGKR